MCYKGIVMFEQGTIKDPFLVRKYADVLSKRLSESYGHLICFAILAKRQKERGTEGDRKFQKKSLKKTITLIKLLEHKKMKGYKP